MRRAIAPAIVAGAAGIVLGLAPLGSAVAAGPPQTAPQTQPQTWWCSDNWRGQDWRTCCDPSRGDDRPSWCWDNSGWNHDGNWNHDSSWDNSSWSHDGNWNHDGNWDNSSWNNDHWNHDDGNWNHDSSWNHDGGWRGDR
ncbi:hypothetical protein [Streptomyces sp. PvR034]|uniref:hypothetical protein n=1 Tax=Streptomyces sp. PvR034 TaxID=3156401 RepID=UPI003396B8F2